MTSYDTVDWAVHWVSPSPEDRSGPSLTPGTGRPAHLLRAEFVVPALAFDEGLIEARLHVAAHGVFDVELNGRLASDELLAPGWDTYRHRLRSRSYPVGRLLSPGRNAIGIRLADGWYRGRLGFNGGVWNNYGDDIAVLAQLELTAGNGSVQVVPLEWSTALSEITATGLYEGESHDARLEQDGWSQPGFDDSSWRQPRRISRSAFPAKIEPPVTPPVRVIEALAPVSIEALGGGRLLVDFGQNIAGKVRFRARGAAGRTITIRHAEVLEDGGLSLRPLRSATSTDRYTFAGDDEVQWTPRFTIHGFRFAELDGWPDDLDPAAPGAIEALVVHSDMRRTGWFDSDNPLLNRFHENVVWSMRDNFVDLPTDCPQRDERLGWSGDIQVFAPTAAFLYDVDGVLRNWLRNLAAEQAETGSVPNFVPWIECGFPTEPAAAWGDAAVIVPWTLYRRTGDASILREQFASMRAWVDQVWELTGRTGHWDRGFQLGDWLDPAAPPDRPGDSRTDPRLVATAYHALSARLVRRTAIVLGDAAAEAHYGEIERTATDAFRAHYVAPAGRIVGDTVTSLAVAIAFDLLETDDQRREAGGRLAELVADGEYRIQTGFVGTPIVCDALAATGHLDDAYHLLLQTDAPSWLYAVTMDATTVWERWDSMLPDGSINPGEMTSFNHYALGAVADFLHRVVGGLAELEPGYRRVRIAPRPGGGLTRARAAFDSAFGRIESAWERRHGGLVLDVTIPAGVEAEIDLLGSSPFTVGEGNHRFETAYRGAEEDPARPRRWNVHNPDERLEMIEAGIL
ncbi:family 78 glycoside hydrolase catalytic domain [Agromyces seonyuensis]|uniref:alpha-L-rhamnosidase n=1 Tax=Agromyces seonyuensis TaxID=2662446 RepID=A0A6I4NXG3_9MICO|nr:family 78 glycoside hydrolase catalytic domain [Agromyces seonyuensis]MWB98881.1 family 78 glycoside hydrolase catalytic domain [Agromyces seonyuensis]